jgi:hypothetical protein
MKTIARLAALSILGGCVFTAGSFADAGDAEAGASSRPTADTDLPQAGTGALANYTILKTTDFGKSITRNFPAKPTARQVVKATVPDFVAIFGQNPELVGVYQDQKDKKSAYVFFSATLAGQPVKGISVIKVTDAAIARMQQQQLDSERNFADVDEGIRGYRKVYDMKTGEEADVNLGDVNGVVNALNEADPGRYVQVPLRDEVGR